MHKLILLTISLGSFLLANTDSQIDDLVYKSKNNDYGWEQGSDDFKADAGRRRGKGPRGRRRGGSGLR
ncbi:MAG: hypothetical protein VX820_04155 [Candidatus Neomarinimicrobiota bacterium]|nr:hypothetical protein [Candidatus Neomarinimicrobiota bacterium]